MSNTERSKPTTQQSGTACSGIEMASASALRPDRLAEATASNDIPLQKEQQQEQMGDEGKRFDCDAQMDKSEKTKSFEDTIKFNFWQTFAVAAAVLNVVAIAIEGSVAVVVAGIVAVAVSCAVITVQFHLVDEDSMRQVQNDLRHQVNRLGRENIRLSTSVMALEKQVTRYESRKDLRVRPSVESPHRAHIMLIHQSAFFSFPSTLKIASRGGGTGRTYQRAGNERCGPCQTCKGERSYLEGDHGQCILSCAVYYKVFSKTSVLIA